MADSTIAITAGTGTNVDTRTEATNGHHRQVIVVGDPATNAGVAPVDATAGLKVDLGADNDVVVTNAGTFATQATLQAGSAAIGKLAANSGVDIGDVDVTSSALPTGASTSAKQDTQITAEQAIQTSVELIDDAVRAEDVASGDGHKGVVMMAVRQDTPANTSATDGDYEMPKMSAGRLWVDASGKTLTVDGSGVTQPVSGTVTANLAAGTNNIGDVDVLSIAAGNNNIGDVDIASIAAGDNNIGNVDIVSGTITTVSTVTSVTAIANALPAGTNAIGKLAANSGVDIGDVDVTSISAGTNLIGDVGIQPRTTNGLDTFMASGSDGSSILVATAQAVKASAGKVYGYYLYNPEAAVTFVHFYNTASASVTVGTTAPLFTLPIPAGSAANLGITDMGVTFGTAIAVSATTTAGGNTAPATGVSAVIWFK